MSDLESVAPAPQRLQHSAWGGTQQGGCDDDAIFALQTGMGASHGILQEHHYCYCGCSWSVQGLYMH